MNIISGKTFDEERALYGESDIHVAGCSFAGPADGESAFKEAHDIEVSDCSFSLRYPFWHTKHFTLSSSHMDGGVRAAMWYAEDGKVSRCSAEGVKFLRECRKIAMEDCEIKSDEVGWKCHDITMNRCEVTSSYFMTDSTGCVFDNLTLNGKYSFQYVRGCRITDSVLNTKDAFWHSENTVVENTEISGEYLGWYSRNLTLINCKISGTQPLCYCKGLKLISCTMDGADLSFECSDVEADVKGHILSVKNPSSGHITADSIGEIIDTFSAHEKNAEITVRG